jgi:hypothetical protein
VNFIEIVIINQLAEKGVSNPKLYPAFLPRLNQRLERGTPAGLVDKNKASAFNEIKAGALQWDPVIRG